jgi:hypothetical protein
MSDIKKELIDFETHCFETGQLQVGELMSTAIMHIAELENPWISVDDRLPEPKAKILLHSNSLEVFSGRGSVLIATNTMPEPVLGIRSRYTHWMPQPLPKEQE